MLSLVWFVKTVLNGSSPEPKSSRFIPVIISNSVFTVPAPTTGTVKYPLGHSLYNFSKLGTGLSESLIFVILLRSKNDSNWRKIILGVFSVASVAWLSSSSTIFLIELAE